MAPSEAIVSKKLDELESEVDFLEDLKEDPLLSQPRLASIRSKLAFLKSLLAADTGASSDEASSRLTRIAGRISAFEEPKSDTSDSTNNSNKLNGMKRVLLLKNLEELESAANTISGCSPEPVWNTNSSKILGKIAFTRSLLAAEEQGDQLSSTAARLAAVEEAFGHLVSTDSTPPSCSRASSCHTEEVEEEAEARAPWLVSLRSKIEDLEQDINGDGYDDAQRKIRFFKSLLAAEMKWKGGEKADDFDSIVKKFSSIESEFADRNRRFGNEDDADGGCASSPCSCTSSCFEEGQEKENEIVDDDDDEEVVGSVSGINDAGDSCSPETVEMIEANSETDDSERGSVGAAGTGGGTRFGKLRAVGAMAGVLAVAAVAAAGVVIGSFYSELNPVYLVPT